MENWSFFVVVLAAALSGYFYVAKFTHLNTDEQVEKVKEWLLWAVMKAEAEFGSGTGKLKLHYVYDLFVQRFPTLVNIISFEMFSWMVDEVLEEMRHILDTNLDITYALGIGGGDE